MEKVTSDDFFCYSSGIFPKFWTFRENLQRLDPRKLTNVPLKKGPFHKERFHSLKLTYLLKRQFWRWFSERPKVGYYVIVPWRVCLPAIFSGGHLLVFGEVTVTQKWNLFCQGGFYLSMLHVSGPVFGDLGFSCSIQKLSFRWGIEMKKFIPFFHHKIHDLPNQQHKKGGWKNGTVRVSAELNVRILLAWDARSCPHHQDVKHPALMHLSVCWQLGM